MVLLLLCNWLWYRIIRISGMLLVSGCPLIIRFPDDKENTVLRKSNNVKDFIG